MGHFWTPFLSGLRPDLGHFGSKRGSKNDPKMTQKWVILGPPGGPKPPQNGSFWDTLFEQFKRPYQGKMAFFEGPKWPIGGRKRVIFGPFLDPYFRVGPMWVGMCHNVPGLTPSIWGHGGTCPEGQKGVKKGSKKGQKWPFFDPFLRVLRGSDQGCSWPHILGVNPGTLWVLRTHMGSYPSGGSKRGSKRVSGPGPGHDFWPLRVSKTPFSALIACSKMGLDVREMTIPRYGHGPGMTGFGPQKWPIFGSFFDPLFSGSGQDGQIRP